MDQFIEITGKKIGKGYPPYIVAELSANHCGSLETALKSIEIAKVSGADAIKLQTYTPDTMTIKSNKTDFNIKAGLWQGTSLYDLYQKAHTPLHWHKALFKKARQVGITIFSSPFDETAVDLLEQLDTPAYKLASFELTDLPLIEYIAKTGKPLIMSTGMASLSEIEQAVATAKAAGCKQLILLHCISSYPASFEQCNLYTINDMARRFNIPVGLSDHTRGITGSVAAVSLGACLIEKHFTPDKNNLSPDASFSITPEDLKQLCRSCYDAWQALGKVSYLRSDSEKENMKFRRSVYFVKDMKKDECITREHIRRIRPGYGLAPKYFNGLIGQKVNADIDIGMATSWDLIDNQ